MKRTHATIARNRQAGFSLIEMIAAFLVFAIAIGILMQILTSSMHSTRASNAYTMAALWAESKLDTIGVGAPIEAGSSSGRFDDSYSWQLDIQQIDPASVEPPPQQYATGAGNAAQQNAGMQQRGTTTAGNPGAIQVQPFDLFQIDLTVFWGGRFGSQQHTARFSTLRTMNPDPNSQMGAAGTPNAMGRQQTGGVRR
jgi:general secretion pathway protein I